MEGFSMEGMSAQAQQIWTMLDDMAENNPAAYRKFIDKQLKEGKDQMALPEPHMCVQVLLLGKPKQRLFINFCSWNRIPEPKSAQDPVHVSGTPITQEVDDKGTYSLTSVAFNPKVLEEYGRKAKNPTDADTLVQLALDYVEQEQKVKVSRSYTVLPVDTTHKGDLTLIQMTFSKSLSKNKFSTDFDTNVNHPEKKFNSETSQGKDSLLSQLSNISMNDSANRHSQTNGSQPSINILSEQNNVKPKKGLIEEINNSTLPTPKYSLTPLETECGRALILSVNLPDVKGVSECELDISEDEIELTVGDRYELKLRLPSPVNEEEASAKFSKKLSTLTVTMPVKS